MDNMNKLEYFHSKIYNKTLFQLLTWTTRVLLAFGFISSGLKKILKQRFTILSSKTPVGFFFQAS